MKTRHFIACATSLSLFLSCNNSAQTTTGHTVQQAPVDSTTQANAEEGNKIDYDNTKVIRTVYVIDRKGADMKQQASTDAKSLGSYAFGERLDVIEETAEWLGVRDRITREFMRDGDKIQSNGWEKVYVLKKNTGSMDEISLIPADLNIVSLVTVDQKTQLFEKGKPLAEYIKLELIDRSVFDGQRSKAVDFLLADTAVHKKRDGVIELVCQEKTVKYVDKPDAEEEIQEFQYVGQVEFLNRYLITGSYWESGDYRFIDKVSGGETNIFEAYPNISPDRKHIICINSNPYEITADLELYSISDSKIDKVMAASFKNWMPTGELSDMFWGADGNLYSAVSHVSAFWKTDGNLNDKFQYIRIKLL